MWRAAVLVPIMLATAPSSSAQYAEPVGASSAATPSSSIAYSISDWRRLRQSSGYRFADYAAFLIANPGWPDEARLRSFAENAMRKGENPSTVIAFFTKTPPDTGTGWAQLSIPTRRWAGPPTQSKLLAKPGSRPILLLKMSRPSEIDTEQISHGPISIIELMLCSLPERRAQPSALSRMEAANVRHRLKRGLRWSSTVPTLSVATIW